MDIEKNTKYGSINISLDAIAQIAGKAATECYGVVGMSKKNSLKDGISELLNIENYSKGVYVKKNNKGLIEVDIYIVMGYGLRITEAIAQVQKRVKYELEKNLNIKFSAVNVYVQGVKNI
ncbi:MAG: Asp23/Gls24 family envelope stress response protein [Bacillales bacterium]|nr:Asp23/Gls24 family envelope stress response protein [Bacillales bacterium]